MAIVAVWTGTVVGLRLLLAGRIRLPRLVDGPGPAALFVALTAAAALFVYPAVDDRQSVGGGSDTDDAVLVVLDGIRNGDENPYGTDTYLGNPPASGPGSLVWFAPVGTRALYPLGLIAAAAALVAALRWATGGWRTASLTVALVAGSLPWWEALAQGSDHVPLACALAGAAALADRATRRAASGARLDPGLAVVGALVLGTLATTRAAYAHVPLLVAVALWRVDRRAAVAVGAAGTAVVVALHGALVARVGWDDYAPVQQLLVKSDEDLTSVGRAVVAVGVLGAVVLVAAFLLRRPAAGPAPLLLAGVGAPMVAIAVAGLLTAREPAQWSAGNYFLDTVPLAAYWVVAKVSDLSSDP